MIACKDAYTQNGNGNVDYSAFANQLTVGVGAGVSAAFGAGVEGAEEPLSDEDGDSSGCTSYD